MLDHIHIENFRMFRELDIPKVGQVNLITGKNNAGKTTILEALRLYDNILCHQFPNPDILLTLLKERGDEGMHTLAHGRQEFPFSFSVNGLEIEISYTDIQIKQIPKVKTYFEVPLTINVRTLKSGLDESNFIPANFLLTNVRLWKDIELTDKEDKVADILKIIEPKIVRVSVDADGTAKVRLSNSSRPLPLKNFGEGMNRLLTIALGLVSAENNMLLIDEIDLGLHHSVQHLLWKIVFQKAKDLNVQVFATTHSSDCVEAFSNIANKLEYEGMGNYIRLQRSKKDGNIMAVDYEMEQLENALDLNSETR
jgi:AAA15 family ATPase/GTPase